jgi:3-keto-5-aminohexanoate cleavage enzyme
MAKKLIIQVCPIGSGGTLHEDTPRIPKFGKRTPYLPITPKQVAEESKRCYDAGASLVHIHARDSETMMPTPDIKVWGEIVSQIRAKCPLVIEAGGGIGPWVKNYETLEMAQPTTAQKLALLDIKPEPDMLTVNVGTFDFTVGPRALLFDNDYDYQKQAIEGIKKKGWGLEVEIYDVSHLHNFYRHVKEGRLSQNDHFHLDYAMGIDGGMPATPEMMMFVVQEGKRLFPNAQWQALGIGRYEMPMVTMAMIMGADSLRVGLEDNIYLSQGVMAKSNAELVEKVVRIARELDYEIATVEEAREILHLKKK